MTKKIFHIILAISVFLSTGGFLTNSHFCNYELESSSIFVILGNCCSSGSSFCSDEKMMCSIEDPANKCCNNKSEFHILDQDQILIKDELQSLGEFELFISAVPYNAGQIIRFDLNNQNYTHYIPPPIVFDLQVRLQTFLC